MNGQQKYPMKPFQMNDGARNVTAQLRGKGGVLSNAGTSTNGSLANLGKQKVQKRRGK